MLYLFFPGVAKDQLVSTDGEKLNRDFFANIPPLAELLAGVVNVPNDAMVSDAGRGSGPGGHSGAVVTLPPSNRPADFVGNAPGRQHWVDCGGWWIGCMVDAVPTPQDLERPTQIPGYLVKDADGHEWRVPVARALRHPLGSLPQFFTFGADGRPIANVAKSHLWLWELSGKIAEAYASDGAADFTQLVRWAMQILQVNYRIDRRVVNLLAERGRNVLTQTTVHAICQAVYGFEIEEEIKKKSAPVSAASDPPQNPPS
jgi:hypothetical protein